MNDADRSPILVLDAATDGCLAAIVANGAVVAQRTAPGGRGSAAALPALAAAVLHQAGLAATGLAHIAVTVGPGSFTGVRAALALAHGIGLAAHIPVAGVTVAEAMRAAETISRPIWIAIDSRRARVFLDTDGTPRSVALGAIPAPPGPVAIAGNAAIAVASRMAARGDDVQLLAARACTAAGIAAASLCSTRPAIPLYVDPVAARPNPPNPPPA